MSAQFGQPSVLVCSVGCPSVDILSAREKSAYANLRGGQRRRDWLNGRAALKRLLKFLGEDEDTSALVFPHPRISLSHAGAIAVALGTDANAAGFGVDYEPIRAVKPGLTRWFLVPHERAWLARQPTCRRDEAIVRLWTIKEAAYKSHPHNAALSLSELSIERPGATSGIVLLAASGERIRYITRPFARGFVTGASYLGNADDR